VIVEVLLEVLLPLRGPTCNQDCEGLPTDHVKPSPPPSLTTIDWDGAALPEVALKVSEVALSCMAGDATLMVIGTVVGLPLAVLPVAASVALTSKVAL
jgi:hypothetical protein